MTAKHAEHSIYELLDITPDASPALAHEMYWRKLQPYIAHPERSDQPAEDHTETIEALNQALAIVLDERLRAEYDAAHPDEVRHQAKVAAQPRSQRRGVITVIGITTIAALLLFGTFGPVAALVPLPFAFFALTFLQIRAAEIADEPAFATLHLRGTASQEQIEIAYRVRAQQILLRIRRDPRVISELDELDKAYIRAMTVVLGDRSESGTGKAPSTARVSRVTASALRVMQGPLERAGRLALRSAQDIRSVTQREMAARTYSTPSTEAEEQEIDLQHRLSAGLKSGAEHIALAAPPASVIPAIEADREGITAYLLLESAMGTRRVQLGEKPVSIGTSPACDLALPEQEGIEPEHVLVWQHGTRIVLHADLNATCLVNESPVTWALLEDGDRLQVGTYTLRVSVDAA
jgi:hypothetical protein